MFKSFKLTCILLVLALAVCSAEPPRYRFRTSGRLRQQSWRVGRLLARQEAAPAYYPSADELKPEVPFVEEEIASEPDQSYGPPDQTYGPPDQTYGPPEVEQLPSAGAPQEFAPNPDAEEFATAPSRFTSFNQHQRQRFNKKVTSLRLQQQSKAKVQRTKTIVNSQRLVAVAAPVAVAPPAPITVALPFQSQQYVVVNQPFAYSAQYQSW